MLRDYFCKILMKNYKINIGLNTKEEIKYIKIKFMDLKDEIPEKISNNNVI